VLAGVCNNGYVAFTGYLTASQARPQDYTGSADDPTATTLPLWESYGAIYMNSLGDIVFDDVYAEEWYEAINLTGPPSQNQLEAAEDLNLAPIPEPATFLLLGTGTLFAVAISRRRLMGQK
jgi:PEP-CTERM motif